MLGTGWKGNTGGLMVVVGGLIKLFVDEAFHHTIDTVVNGLISIGAGLGIIGIRDAQNRK